MYVGWKPEYGHRSVKKIVKRFCGWKKLYRLYNDSPDDTSKLLWLSLFKTGGRISEVLTLEREQIEEKGDFILVLDMPVLKIWKKKGNVKVRQDVTRTVPIYRYEPLSEEWIELMPDEGKFFSFQYDKAYKIIRDLQKKPDEKHGEWFPHRFRAERARQLVRDYGYDALELKTFFGWRRMAMPEHYAQPHLKQLEDRILTAIRK